MLVCAVGLADLEVDQAGVGATGTKPTGTGEGLGRLSNFAAARAQ